MAFLTAKIKTLSSLALVIAAAAALVSSHALAADMLAAPTLEPPVDETPVTLGSGWYLRGDVGLAKDIALQVGGVTLPSSSSFPNSWSVSGGAGYKYNNWFRTDITADWRKPRTFSGASSASPSNCFDGFTPVQNSFPVAYQAITSPCTDILNARINNLTFLLNGYVDLGTWSGFTPYLGAGVGVNYSYQKMATNWFYIGNGNTATQSFTNPATGTVYSQNFDQNRSTSSFQLAWALMAGTSYAFTPNVSVDLGYRYLNLGNITNFASFGGSTTQKQTAQEVRLGLRYTPD